MICKLAGKLPHMEESKVLGRIQTHSGDNVADKVNDLNH
jgi:hypothetical protein